MNPVLPVTVSAIKADEFARKAIEAARELLYIHFRDWETLHREGKIIFTNEEAMVTYMCLSVLLDTEEEPNLGPDARVNVGGVMLKVSTIKMLNDSLRIGAKKKEGGR